VSSVSQSITISGSSRRPGADRERRRPVARGGGRGAVLPAARVDRRPLGEPARPRADAARHRRYQVARCEITEAIAMNISRALLNLGPA
jgi:hypothetical protein